jgi:hypothetical protein
MKERDLKQIFELACTLRRLHGMLAVSSKDRKSVRLGFGRGASHSTQPETKDTRRTKTEKIPYRADKRGSEAN